MKKEIQKPFDIDAIRNGAHAKTNLGEEVEFVGECSNEEYPFVFYHNGLVGTYDFNGRYSHDYDNRDEDIIIVEEVEEPERWADNKDARGEAWYMNDGRVAGVVPSPSYVKLNNKDNFDAFATKKQAKSALAMARISQLMAHDERYGCVVTDEEWQDDSEKYCIGKCNNILHVFTERSYNFFLAFHTEEQCDLFLSENEQLVKDYLMID